MKQRLLLKTMLLLCALVAGSLSVWADVVSGKTYDTKSTSSLPTGWSGSDGGGTTYVKLTASSNYIQTSNFTQNGFTSITLKARKFGGPTDAEALITVSWYDSSTSAETELGTVAPSNTTLTDYTISSPTNPTGNTTGYIKIQCKGAGSSKGSGVSQVTITYTAPEAAVETPTFSPVGGTYTSTQSVTLDCETTGADIYYTLDGSTPTSGSTPYTGAISVSETKTIKAIAIKGSDASNVAEATYTIYPVLHAGTEADPYTVADARNAIDANIGITGVYVSGIVCEGGSELSSGALNYWISDDGTETNKFEIYKGKGISGADFAATTDVKEGDAVVVKGDIKKFGSVYEFNSGNQLVSLVPSANPLISVTPSSLTGFTYGVGFGPSEAKTFSVEGSNLTADISLSLGESNYEMSLTEGSGYTNSLTLTQTAGAVAATTIYVRLKAGLAVNASYSGSVALTSTGATNKAISLAGSVTQPNFTWDLSTDNTATASSTELTWTGAYASMGVQKGASTTDANNYYPGTSGKTYTSTRFYSNSYLTIAPTSGNTITSIEFTATSSTYATALKNSTWSNASAAVDDKTVTITPTNGALPISATVGATCGFTAVKVYYEVAASVTLTPAKTYTTLTSSHNLDFSSVSSDLKAYIATEVSAGRVQMTQVNKVPTGTGLVLEATTPDAAVVVPIFDGTGADDVSANKMTGSATATTAVAANAGYILSDGIFQPASKGTLAAGQAYLNIAVSAGAPVLVLDFGNGHTTGVYEVRDQKEEVRGEVYNLAGQRIAQPTKGLYIVNGRKVIVK
jgi:hypothetical protein